MPAPQSIPDVQGAYGTMAKIALGTGDAISRGIGDAASQWEESKKRKDHVARLYSGTVESLIKNKEEMGLDEEQFASLIRGIAPDPDEDPEAYEKRALNFNATLDTWGKSDAKKRGMPITALDLSLPYEVNVKNIEQANQKAIDAGIDASFNAPSQQNSVPSAPAAPDTGLPSLSSGTAQPPAGGVPATAGPQTPQRPLFAGPAPAPDSFSSLSTPPPSQSASDQASLEAVARGENVPAGVKRYAAPGGYSYAPPQPASQMSGLPSGGGLPPQAVQSTPQAQAASTPPQNAPQKVSVIDKKISAFPEEFQGEAMALKERWKNGALKGSEFMAELNKLETEIRKHKQSEAEDTYKASLLDANTKYSVDAQERIAGMKANATDTKQDAKEAAALKKDRETELAKLNSDWDRAKYGMDTNGRVDPADVTRKRAALDIARTNPQISVDQARVYGETVQPVLDNEELKTANFLSRQEILTAAMHIGEPNPQNGGQPITQEDVVAFLLKKEQERAQDLEAKWPKYPGIAGER